MNVKKIIISGWLILLILLLASSMVQAYSAIYYVIPSSVSLRECAADDCAPLLTVYKGEKVAILERTGAWSKVSLVDRAAMGWIHNDLLSYSPDLQGVHEPPYYVRISSVPLRDKPNPNANTLTTLHLNDPVEMLGVGTSGWAQVRELRTSQVGWVDPRYLSKGSPSHSGSSPRRRAPVRKAPPKEEKKAPEKTPSAPEEAPSPPHAM